MNLKDCLSKRGISQRMLAKKAGVEHASLSRWISGHTRPRIDSLKKIADALGVSVEVVCKLMNGYEDTPTETITGMKIVFALNTVKLVRDMTFVMLEGQVPEEASYALNIACRVLSHNNDRLLTREHLLSEVKLKRPEEVTPEDATSAATTLQSILTASEAMKKETTFVHCSHGLRTTIHVLMLVGKVR